MEAIDFFGHIFYVFILYGLILLNHKSKWGWFYRFAGEAGWCVLGFMMGMTSIWTWGLVFMVIDIRGFIKWHR